MEKFKGVKQLYDRHFNVRIGPLYVLENNIIRFFFHYIQLVFKLKIT